MEEKESDFSQRRQAFLDEYGELVKKYHCDFLSTPTYMPTPERTWSLMIHTDIMDTTDSPTLSPFQ